MRILFTCGGTAGHVNPALALAGRLRELEPACEILFVGAERGLEKDLVPQAGYPFRTVHISSLHRSLKPQEIRHNVISAYNLLRAPSEARGLLREFKPDCVVGTGGYACFPMVRAAAKAGIPTAIHESNMIPGLTTKMLIPYAGKILVGFEDCRRHYPRPEKVVVTGTPVRGEFFRLTKAQAREKLGVAEGKPLVLSFWGSLGAGSMNRQMAEFFELEAAKEPFYHIHAAGKNGYAPLADELKARGVELTQHPNLQLREYIYDMATAMAAADLVLCRAGAATISELTALGVPAIIVPSPNVTGNHQEKNARVLEEHGGSCVVVERESSGKVLFQRAASILGDEGRQRGMALNMKKLGIPDATERICRLIVEMSK